MTQYTSDAQHQPKGAHSRRLSLGLDPDKFAAEAGITTEQLRDYERTSPDHDFDADVAQRVAAALDRLERHNPNLQTGRSEEPGHNAPVLDHGGSMDHSRHLRLMEHELVPDVLEGATIYGAGDHTIGKVSHLHGSGPSAQVIIDVGGFLGLGAKPVSVNMAQLDFMRDDNGHVHAVTPWTKQDLEKMPEHRHH
jgi:hypothetical protein